MSVPFAYKPKRTQFKNRVVDDAKVIADRFRQGRQNHGSIFWRRMGPGLALLVLTACGPFGISIEVDDGGSDGPAASAEVKTATPGPEVTVVVTEARDSVSDIPELVWHPFLDGLDERRNVLTVRPDQVGFEQSPVDFATYWDYSGATGKLAYAPEFWHAARGANPPSVSDLWVYGYETGEAVQWLPDNVGRALWSPLQPGNFADQRLAAAIYNTEEGRYDLGLLSGPQQVEWLANCASPYFSWSPDATEIAYVAFPFVGEGSGVPAECQGAFVVSIQDREVRQLSDIRSLMDAAWPGNRPLWAEEAGALLFSDASPESIFWVIKTDGSETFQPVLGEEIEEEHLPTPRYSLWSSEHHSVIGQVESMMDPFGVWVYTFSEDLRTIEEAYRINWGEYRHEIVLVDWWEPGESVLLRDMTNTSAQNPFGVAMVWSLSDQYAFELAFSRSVIEVPLYPQQVRTGVEEVDQVIENFLVRKFFWRREMVRTLTTGCTLSDVGVGPPLCQDGQAEGTEVEVFPYRKHRVMEYATLDELDTFLEFPLGGLYAVYRVSETGFEAEWAPRGEYSVVFVSAEGELGVEVIMEGGEVVRIEFWPLTPVEFLYGRDVEYLLPPLAE